jgi:hypothetical protein
MIRKAPKVEFKNSTLSDALTKAGLSPIDLTWNEHSKGRRFAPLPDCKLRRLARKAGFLSSAEFLAAERARSLQATP